MAGRDCDILAVPPGTDGALTLDFATVASALQAAAFPVEFSVSTFQRPEGATTTGRQFSFFQGQFALLAPSRRARLRFCMIPI